MSLPFVLVAEASSKENGGVNMGVMNVFVVLPQLCVSLLAGPIVKANHDDSTFAMLVGAVFALLGVASVYFIIVPQGN